MKNICKVCLVKARCRERLLKAFVNETKKDYNIHEFHNPLLKTRHHYLMNAYIYSLQRECSTARSEILAIAGKYSGDEIQIMNRAIVEYIITTFNLKFELEKFRYI